MRNIVVIIISAQVTEVKWLHGPGSLALGAWPREKFTLFKRKTSSICLTFLESDKGKGKYHSDRH